MTDFSTFLRERYGTTWCVAPRLTAGLRAKGYTAALSEKHYRALQREWAEAEADRILPTLTAGEIRELLIVALDRALFNRIRPAENSDLNRNPVNGGNHDRQI